MNEMMKFSGYEDKQFKNLIPDAFFECMINPSNLEKAQLIGVEERDNTKETGTTTETLNFEIVLDCTGIVDKKRIDLPYEIQQLEKVLFTCKRGNKTSNYIQIQWGKHIDFKGKIKQFNLSYTLFKPDGTPLRAKIYFEFEN